MHEYASIMLNMIEYASTYLKKNKTKKKTECSVCQNFEYA